MHSRHRQQLHVSLQQAQRHKRSSQRSGELILREEPPHTSARCSQPARIPCSRPSSHPCRRYYKMVATQAAGAEDIRSWSVTVTQHTDSSCSTAPMRYTYSKPNGQCVFCLDSGCGGTIENMTCGTGSNLVEIDTGCDGNLRQVTSPMQGGYANAWKCQSTSFGNSYSVVTLCKNHEYLVNATSGITTSGLASFGNIDTPWTKASSSDSSDDDNTGLIVGVVIGGAVLLGVVAFVCMKIAKKKDPVGATMSL